MGKIWIEVCLLSARGLCRSSSFWKLQWFAVGWIDPNNKYCTKVDASGNANPGWKTKFSTLVDSSETNFEDLELHVEVYSREPIFLRERLQGTATVVLKEFLAKKTEGSKPESDVGSFQLRKRNSNKPQGFVDISIRISEEKGSQNSYPGNEEGLQLMDHGNGITLASTSEEGLPRPYSTDFPLAPSTRPPHRPLTHPMPFPPNYSNPSSSSSSSSSQPIYNPPPRTHPPPPPPPPPSNVGYIPTFLPHTTDHLPQTTYMNMPSAGRGRGGPNFGMGVGAGALAAGAVIFGDDFMSGFDVPSGFNDASLTISTDPPF